MPVAMSASAATNAASAPTVPSRCSTSAPTAGASWCGAPPAGNGGGGRPRSGSIGGHARPHPERLSATGQGRRVRSHAGGGRGRADRRRRRLRRCRPGRAGRGDPARPAAGGRPGHRREAGRDADRGAGQGEGGRRAPAVGGGRESLGAARPAARHRPGHAAGLLRPGHQGVGVHDAAQLRAADPDAAALPQQGQPGVLAVAAGSPPDRAGRAAGGDGAARDRRPAAAGVGRGRARRQDRRQGTRPRRSADRLVRAGRRGACAGDGAVRGHAGSSGRRRHRALPAERPLPAGVEPGREGGVEGAAPARPRHPHAGLAVSHDPQAPRGGRQLHLSDGRRHARDRPGAGARLPRRIAVGARLAAAVQDAPDGAPPARGRASASAGAPRRSPRAASWPSRRASRCRARC